MELRQIQQFLAVVDHGGVNRAAESLYISQPSVSQSIRALERELGARLFHRTGGRLVLAAAGEVLVVQAREVVRSVALAQAMVHAVDGLRTGRLVITSTPSQSVSPLAQLVAAFTSQHPGVVVDVQASQTPDDVVAALRLGQAELGLVGRPPSGELPLNMVRHHLYSDRFIVITRDHAQIPGGSHALTPKDLHGARLIVGQSGSAMRNVADSILALAPGSVAAVEIQHREALIPLVLAGAGLAIVTGSWADLAKASGLIVRDLEVDESLEIAFLRRNGQLSPAASSFLEMVNTEFV